MKVVATRLGFYNGSLRQAGDRFDMPEANKKMPAWVQPADQELPHLMDDNTRNTAAAITSGGPKRVNTPAPRVDVQGEPHADDLV